MDPAGCHTVWFRQHCRSPSESGLIRRCTTIVHQAVACEDCLCQQRLERNGDAFGEQLFFNTVHCVMEDGASAFYNAGVLINCAPLHFDSEASQSID